MPVSGSLGSEEEVGAMDGEAAVVVGEETYPEDPRMRDPLHPYLLPPSLRSPHHASSVRLPVRLRIDPHPIFVRASDIPLRALEVLVPEEDER